MITYEQWEETIEVEDLSKKIEYGIESIKKYVQVHEQRGNTKTAEALAAILDVVNRIVPFRHLLYEAINIHPYMSRDVRIVNGEKSATMPLTGIYSITGFGVSHIKDEENGKFKAVYNISVGEEYGGKCSYILPIEKVDLITYPLENMDEYF